MTFKSTLRATIGLFLSLFCLASFLGVPVIIMMYPTDIYGVGLICEFLGWSFGILFLISLAVRLWTTSSFNAAGTVGSLPPAIHSKASYVFRKLGKSLWSKIGLAVLIIILIPQVIFGPFLFVYVSILYSLDRFLFFVFFLLAVLAVSFSVRFFNFPKTTFWRLGLLVWLYLCLSLVFFTVFKWGPRPGSCEKYYDQRGVRAVLTREQLRMIEGQERSLPYDSVMSGDGRHLIVSLKRTDAEPGALVKVDIQRREVVSILMTGNRESKRNEFPERLAISQQRKEVYALVYSRDHHSVLVADYSDDGLRIKEVIPLPGEPRNVFVDLRNHNLILMLTDKPPYRIVLYDMETLQPIRKLSRSPHSDADQFMAFSNDHKWIYLASMGLTHKLFEIDTDTYETVRRKYFFWPFLGIALDEPGGMIYCSSPLTYEVYKIDRAAFELVEKIPVAGGLSDLDIDPELRQLYNGYYGGTLEITDLDSGELMGSIKLGHLLRNIYYDRRAKRLFACSGCGVFEIDPQTFLRTNPIIK